MAEAGDAASRPAMAQPAEPPPATMISASPASDMSGFLA